MLAAQVVLALQYQVTLHLGFPWQYLFILRMVLPCQLLEHLRRMI